MWFVCDSHRHYGSKPCQECIDERWREEDRAAEGLLRRNGIKRIEKERLAIRAATRFVFIPWCTWEHAVIWEVDDSTIEDAPDIRRFIESLAQRGRACSCVCKLP